MTVRPLPQYAGAAAWSLPPVIVLGWAYWRHGDSVDRMPQHWSFTGVADGYAAPLSFFLDCFLPTVGCVILSVLFAVIFDKTVGRWAASLGFGALAAVGAAFALLWCVSFREAFGLTNSRALILVPIAWGTAAFIVAVFGGRRRS